MRIDNEAIYAVVRAIPVGEVITYRDLAEKAGLTSNHARAVGRVLRSRPDREAWRTTPPEDHDIPWWRVVKADGTLLAHEEEDEYSRQWIEWARSVLAREGVLFTTDGRVASLASTQRTGANARGARRSASRRVRTPEPCGRHETVQYSCRACAPS